MTTVASLTIEMAANVARLQADMARAANTVQSATAKMQKAAETAGRALGAIGAGLTVAAFTGFIRGAIDLADGLNKLSQRTGIATEALSQLQYAAKLSDVGADSLNTAIKKLNVSIAQGASGDKEKIALFQSLGITLKTTTGQVKAADQVLLEIADRFSKAKDGAAKTAIAVGLLGKAGDEMVPFLNQGAEGIKELQAEADKLGLTIGTEFAKSAEEFNDNLTRVQVSSQKLAISFAGDFVAGLGKAMKAMADAAIEGGKLAGIVAGIQTLLTGDDAYKNNVAIVKGTEAVLAAENALDKARSRNDQATVERLTRAVKLRREELAVAQKYGKVLDAEREKSEAAGKAVEKARTQGGVLKLPGGDSAALKAANKELEEQRKLIAELNGLQPDYIEQLTRIGALRAKATLSETEYVAAVEALIAKQPSSIKLAKEQADAIKQVADAEEDGLKVYAAYLSELQKGVTTQRERIAALELEAEAERLAETLNISLARAVELVNVAKLEERRLSERDPAVIKALEDEIAARKRIAELTGNKDAREVNKQAAQDAANEWKRFTDDLERGLTDSLFRAFEAGRGFFSTLWEGIKNLFKTTVLKLVIQGVVGSVGAGVTGLAQAAGGTGSASGALGALQNLNTAQGLAQAATGFSSSVSTLTSFFGAGSTAGAAAGSLAYANLVGSIGGDALGAFIAANGSFGGVAAGGAAAGAAAGGAGAAAGSGSLYASAAAAGPYVVAALAVLNALGVFRSKKIVDGGLQGELGGQINDYALQRKGGTLFSGPSYRVLDQGVSAQNQALQDSYSAIRDTVAGMAEQLGLGNDAIKAFTVQLGNDLIHPDTGGFGIKTQGLTQDEIVAKIEAALVSANEQLAAFALGTEEYTREGETASQTLARLVGSLNTVNGVFDALGLALIDVSKAAPDAAQQFIDLFGGAEQFATVANSYYQNFYTESERTAATVEGLRQRFFELGTAGATTREEFRALVEEQQRVHGATSPVVAELLKLESTFASVVPAIDAVTEAAAQQAEQAQQQAAAINAERSDRLRIERETAQAAKAAADELAKLNEQNYRLAISAGNIGKAIASSSQTGPRFADYQGPGGFNAAGYNAANIAAQQRSYQQVLADTQRQNPFEVADYFGVISELQRNIASLTDNLNSGEFNGGSSSIEQAAQQAFGGFLNPEQIQAAADGLTSFSNVLSLVSGTAAQGAIGADQALRVLEGAYTGVSKQSVEYARGLEIIGQSVGVATGNLQDIQAAIQSGLDYFNSGEYYQAIAQEQLRVQVQFTSRAFAALTERASAFNVEADGLETSFDVLDGFIGRLKSVQDAFANAGGDRAAEAGLISDAARRIGEIITTPVAEAARNALADLPSFAGLDDGKLRDLSLLLKDLGQFDNAGLEKTFIRVSEALASGAVTGEQYAALIEYTESVYLGTATALNAVAEAGAAAADILREREGLELRILQLQGNTAELRRRELEALDPSNRAFQQFIYLLEDQARLEADAARLADAFGSIRDSVRDLIDGLVIDSQRSFLSPSQILGEAERQYRMNLAGAFEGDTQAAGQLGGSVNALLEAARNSATSEVDYNRTFGRTVGDLQGLESFAGQRATTDDVVAELRAVRAELAEVNKELDAQRAELRAGMAQIASNTGKTKDQLQGWTVNGLPATET